jgi:hypothetical protein
MTNSWYHGPYRLCTVCCDRTVQWHDNDEVLQEMQLCCIYQLALSVFSVKPFYATRAISYCTPVYLARAVYSRYLGHNY